MRDWNVNSCRWPTCGSRCASNKRKLHEERSVLPKDATDRVPDGFFKGDSLVYAVLEDALNDMVGTSATLGTRHGAYRSSTTHRCPR